MTQSLSLITTLACTQMRLTPAEAILGVTINAARALERNMILEAYRPRSRPT
jgi:imidazolonepropionase-like amidohydrolase